jgi:hypothetical protein
VSQKVRLLEVDVVVVAGFVDRITVDVPPVAVLTLLASTRAEIENVALVGEIRVVANEVAAKQFGSLSVLLPRWAVVSVCGSLSVLLLDLFKNPKPKPFPDRNTVYSDIEKRVVEFERLEIGSDSVHLPISNRWLDK